ncbi:hypothetical protein [Enterobacter mori]|uniref:hypothetical protein n=1 Tax=Enterobacter mori TaxID=539813 RepID=UPI001C4852B7|nr:hypothetical protein [Enterobacter mori]QXM22607.1 hypothetical protein HUI94_20570 [Enterobacter mori]
MIKAHNYETATITQKKNGKSSIVFEVTVRPFRLYSIGNSHTWDLEPDSNLVTMAKANGIVMDNDWHINCGHNIDNITHHPDNTCVPSKFYKYKKAINSVTNDAITIEAFFGSTGKAEVDTNESLTDEIRNSKSKHTKIYIYCTWTQNDSKQLDVLDYAKVCNSVFQPKNIQRNNTSIIYLKDRFINDNYFVSGFIPAGDYLSDFDAIAKKDGIEGIDGAGNVYRDYFHKSNIGKLLIAKQYLSTIFNIEDVQYADGTYIPGHTPDRDIPIPESIKNLQKPPPSMAVFYKYAIRYTFRPIFSKSHNSS